MTTRQIAAAALLLALGACAEAAEPSEPVQAASKAEALSSVTSTTVKGYAHTAQASRMNLGENVVSDKAFEFTRLVGSRGVLAFGNHGVVLGVPNADTKLVPFSRTGEEHTKLVSEYFVRGGIPSDQLGPTQITASMESSGLVADKKRGIQAKPTLVGYTSILNRQAAGIPVVGSYAWARLGDDGVVNAEEIFWPELPADLVTKASALKASLATDAAKALAAKLPQEYAGKALEVVIFHSPHFQDSFEAEVLVVAPTSGDARRFRADGSEHHFKFETQKPTDDVKI